MRSSQRPHLRQPRTPRLAVGLLAFHAAQLGGRVNDDFDCRARIV
jgi:hypothetical protein